MLIGCELSNELMNYLLVAPGHDDILLFISTMDLLIDDKVS